MTQKHDKFQFVREPLSLLGSLERDASSRITISRCANMLCLSIGISTF